MFSNLLKYKKWIRYICFLKGNSIGKYCCQENPLLMLTLTTVTDVPLSRFLVMTETKKHLISIQRFLQIYNYFKIQSNILVGLRNASATNIVDTKLFFDTNQPIAGVSYQKLMLMMYHFHYMRI